MKQKIKIPVLIIVAFSLPSMLYAGVFSFVHDLIGHEAEAQILEETGINSQNMPLLHAAVNTNPVIVKGGPEIAMVNGTSLLAEAGPLGTIADIEEYPSNGQISTYVVRQGDSLAKIAKMYGVSVNTIIWANDIKNGTIKEGQTLVILPISGVQHTVKQGETLKSIVAKYKADLKEVMEYNNLTSSSTLAVGDVITVPDAEITVVQTPKKSSVTSPWKNVGGPSLPGYFIRPLKTGRKTQGLHGYNGIDIGAPVGTPIYAAAGGTVIVASAAGWNHGYGEYIVISHPNGTQTVYGHASKILVSPGEKVAQGQMIGLVGSTGKSTGPHLHFEVRGAANPF
jgi:LysM repeat protein